VSDNEEREPGSLLPTSFRGGRGNSPGHNTTNNIYNFHNHLITTNLTILSCDTLIKLLYNINKQQHLVFW